MSKRPSLQLSPSWCRRQPLDELPRPAARLALRCLLASTGGSVLVEGAEQLAALPDPAIFALNHHNAYEALLAPAALIALRRGRRIRFLVDWMYLELPLAGWLIRQLDPIAVYRKPARWHVRESKRQRGAHGASAADRALAALAAGASVGIYPEGRRNVDAWHLAPGRRGVGVLALRSGAAVVPVGVDFPARDRLGRTPHAGRLVLRIGEPLDFGDLSSRWRESGPPGSAARRDAEREHAPAIVEQVQLRLARLSRKIHLPPENPAMTVAPIACPSPAPGPTTAAEPSVTAERVSSDAQRTEALGVVARVYGDEKGWISNAEAEIPLSALQVGDSSWFLARFDGEPAGAVRLSYDPPLELPQELGIELERGVDLAGLQEAGRFVEIGRLMIAPRFRSRVAVVLALMRVALAEVVGRGYTHLLTVVFEDDPHSPYQFHTRVLGFERIGTHRHGELACTSRRIILTLDIARAYLRLRQSRVKLLRILTAGIEDRLNGLSEARVV